MTTITLPSQLMDELNQVAANQAAPPEKLVEEAVRTYLRQLERKKIREEVKAFEMMPPKLVKQYLGQFIAVHNRQVVDHDENFQMLHMSSIDWHYY
jgi:hypothetical protein